MMNKVDFIIVGQGIAGTLLAHDLIDKSKSVAIIDKNLKASASRVAAGLINPVSMKRCIPSYNSRIYYPKAIDRYKKLELKLGVNLLEEKPILRLFSNQEVKREWQVKFSNTDMHKYISRIFEDNTFNYVNDENGSSEIYPAAHLDVNRLLDKSREYFRSNSILIEEKFEFNQFKANQIKYKSIKSKYIIFCEGYRLQNNPYFKHLPLTPTKGETIKIRIPTMEKCEKIISKGIYIISLGNHYYLVGATYNRSEINNHTTEEGQNFLINKLKEVLSAGFEVICGFAGVRPTVRNRQPLVGLHSFYEKIGVFNGLGTRGALQGPSLSAEFSKVLVDSIKNT